MKINNNNKYHTIKKHIKEVRLPSNFPIAVGLLIVLIIVGTVFYSYAEGWSILDSLYFSVVTVTTIGYGDLHPQRPETKVFTMIYVLFGVGLSFYILTSIAESFIEGREKQIHKLERIIDELKNNSNNKNQKEN